MMILSCNDISKAYIADNIIENISFTVNDNEKIGLIGLNGAGKTTLFNILTGCIDSDTGTFFKAKGKKLGYLKQNTHIESINSIMNEMLTIFENVLSMEEELRNLEYEISLFTENDDQDKLESVMNSYSTLNEKFVESDGYIFRSLIRGVLKGLGFSEDEFDKHINELSGGQKSRVMLAKLLLEKADILLLDEPTNHLDIDAISWLERFIKDFSGSIIIISHDRYFLDNTINKIFLMENKNLKTYSGNYSSFMKKRKADLEHEMKKYEEYEKEVERQEELINRLHSYGSKRNIRQAFSRQKVFDKMKKMDKPTVNSKKVKLRFTPRIKSGSDVLNIQDLSKSFGNNTVFENIFINIYRGERVGIIGPNGIGKSTLLKIVASKIDGFSGSINLGHYVNIGYYDQEQTSLDRENTVIDEIWDDNQTLNYYDIRTMLAQFLFTGDDLFKIISDLSGGEKSRLSLLKLMTSDANFLLMDEPTNHLDIDSKEVLEDSLLNYDGTLLVVSHDRYFLNKVTDKILDMSFDGISEYLGNYDYYIEKKAELNETDAEIIVAKTKTQINAERKKDREISKDKKQRTQAIKEVEDQIEICEDEIYKLEQQLCLPSTYDDKNLIINLNERLNNVKNQLDGLYTQWSNFHEK